MVACCLSSTFLVLFHVVDSEGRTLIATLVATLARLLSFVS